MVSLGAAGKGRSSSPRLLPMLRRLMVLRLFLGIRLLLRHVPSGLNLADGPSRGFRVGPAPETAAKHKGALPFFGQG
eukprot:6369343-Lingulodinium_polyedra.AAC.1